MFDKILVYVYLDLLSGMQICENNFLTNWGDCWIMHA